MESCCCRCRGRKLFGGHAAHGLAGVADEVGDAYPMECVAENHEAGVRAEAGFQFADAGWMTDCVLGKAVGPAADYGEDGWGRRRGSGGRDGQIGVEDAG